MHAERGCAAIEPVELKNRDGGLKSAALTMALAGALLLGSMAGLQRARGASCGPRLS